MKKTLLVLFIFFPFFLFSQESIINNNYENFIKIEPTEVYSSAIFIFEFKPAKEISYDLVYDSMTMKSSTINKGEGTMVKKVDFSLLKKGTYYINFYIDKKNVKQLTFNKL